jgi:hypothetical protein
MIVKSKPPERMGRKATRLSFKGFSERKGSVKYGRGAATIYYLLEPPLIFQRGFLLPSIPFPSIIRVFFNPGDEQKPLVKIFCTGASDGAS